jgi:ABC-type multidrug transport system ATPase subunit
MGAVIVQAQMNAIEIHDLHKVYGTNAAAVRALDGVSFTVPQGRIQGLLGPNGAGKSTVVKILGTITPPTAGRARVMGHDVLAEPLQARRQMAVVLQQTAAETLLTVRDNLLIYAHLHGVSARAARQRLDTLVEEFDLGERLRSTVQELSIGTKRRIQVAKIFMLDTPLVILDEATTGMDPMMRRRVMDRLRTEARNGRTILLTTQVLSEAEELCESILILDRGRAMASGTLQELRTRSKNLFRVQLTFAQSHSDLAQRLAVLAPVQVQVNGKTADMLVHGEEASLLGHLAEISRAAPILQFEVRGPTLEEIFMTLVEDQRAENTA